MYAPYPVAGNPRPLHLIEGGNTLNERLCILHERLLQTVPVVDRIACALYDAHEDTLKTFINSTRSGEAISGYEFKLSQSHALSALAASGAVRVIDNIPRVIGSGSRHSDWLLRQGYRSSYTVPMFDDGAFCGMIFFDSGKTGAFTTRAQIDLGLYSTLINMTISGELAAVRAMTAATQIARGFAHLRDFETGAHLERMARYARLIARGIAHMYNLSDEFVEHVYLFAPLHDIGKIGIPDRVLLKPGPLDAAERALMNDHVAKGATMVDRMLGDFGLQHLPDARIMRNIVACHHECLDGSGYPNRLQGDAVPLEARIVAVADVFDALTSARPYKPAWPVARACEELILMVFAGKLDADCVSVIERHAAEMAEIGERYRDAA